MIRGLCLCVQKGQYLTHQQEDSFVLCISQEKAPGPSPQGLERLRAKHSKFNKKTEMENESDTLMSVPTCLRSPAHHGLLWGLPLAMEHQELTLAHSPLEMERILSLHHSSKAASLFTHESQCLSGGRDPMSLQPSKISILFKASNRNTGGNSEDGAQELKCTWMRRRISFQI